ncbi:hypothetical protein [Vibrio taketomensis]|uniref:hypothetical protein n=1 Tax=Vibrio taketomensis TaxID=2572923 RepID=UPI0013896678|nr:hypothetical protein [Vibrio taketomensis]
MNDNESVKILSEIRDEIKTMNSQIKWLTDKANEAMLEDENREKDLLKAAELENNKSKKDLLTVVIMLIGLTVWFALEKFGLV